MDDQGQKGRAHLVQDGARAARIVVEGEVDVALEPYLRTLIDRAGAAGHPDLVLDFSRVAFADVTAVRVAVRARERAAQRGGRVRVVAGPGVARVFRLTGTDALLRDASRA